MSTPTPAQKKLMISIPYFKELKKAYDDKMKQAGGGMMKMKGRGFFQDAWRWIKTAATDADAWLRKTKLLSTLSAVAGAIGVIPGLQEFLPVAAAIKGAASITGYGKRKMRPLPVMRGGDSRLTINPKGQRLGQRGAGLTISYNGMYAQQPTMKGMGCGCGKMAGGAGTQFYSVSSEFGKIKG
jgi:hypothetical protein